MRESTLAKAWDKLTPEDKHILADCVAFEMADRLFGRMCDNVLVIQPEVSLIKDVSKAGCTFKL